jgi:hypothetical protein
VHPEEIHGLGRSVRRTFFSALIDRTVTPDELRQDLLSLIQGLARDGRQAGACRAPEGHRSDGITQISRLT